MTTLKKQYATLLATTLITLLPGKEALATNLIKNGDFEKIDYTGSYTTYNSATVPDEFDWSISHDFVYLVNSFWSGVSGTNNPDGFDQSVELRPNAILSQTFTTQVAQKYELSFSYAHDPGNEQGYAMGDVNIQGNNLLLSNTLLHNVPSTRADLKFLEYVAQFTADSDATTLSFQGNLLNGSHGFVVDDISVVEVSNTVPVFEPALEFGLLIFVAFFVGFLRQRRPC
ncbi:MAG: DUF642 domain-containing protein [Cyanobacteriota bacterium]|nr:DUF642 domain-containing protein [Cyanobacteriota bacterium]